MYDKTLKNYPYTLQFVPDWFGAWQQLKIWNDDAYYNDDYELIQ